MFNRKLVQTEAGMECVLTSEILLDHRIVRLQTDIAFISFIPIEIINWF